MYFQGQGRHLFVLGPGRIGNRRCCRQETLQSFSCQELKKIYVHIRLSPKHLHNSRSISPFLALASKLNRIQPPSHRLPCSWTSVPWCKRIDQLKIQSLFYLFASLVRCSKLFYLPNILSICLLICLFCYLSLILPTPLSFCHTLPTPMSVCLLIS